MRDLIIFAVVFGSIPYIFKRPAHGILMYIWLSLMNPHRLAYGAAHDFQFAAVIGAVTIVSLLLSKEPKSLPLTPVTAILLIMMGWMSFTSVFALEPDLVWREWDRVMKTFFITVLATMALRTEQDIKRLVWVVALSLGIFGLKGGIFSIATGGQYRVYGPDGSYIAENNSLALGLLTVIPLLWYLKSQATSKWVSIGLVVMASATAIATVGSYSRGGLLGGAVMLIFLWLKGGQRIRNGLLLACMVGAIYSLMPAQWFARMDTIGDYKADASSMGRINAWKFALNVASQNPLGGGFNVFSRRMFAQYAPDPLDFHVAHSIYFQVLGEHGYVGLALFLALMVCVWRSGTRIVRHCGASPELKWAADLAKAVQVALIGFAVGGAFLSLAYFDLYYDIILILILLEKLLLIKQPGAGLPRPAAAAGAAPKTAARPPFQS